MRSDASFVLDERVTFRVEDRRFSWGMAHQWWLVVDGTPVAYLHTMTHAREEFAFVLCDIEVREEWRGRGLARRIIAEAETHIGLRLHTSGSFTPLGARSLSSMPLLPGAEPGVKFADMPFVADWDEMRPINRL